MKIDPNIHTLTDIIKDRKSGVPMECPAAKAEEQSVINVEHEENEINNHQNMFVCKWCQQSLANMIIFDKHERKPHIWKFDFCAMAFLENFDLKQHQTEKHTKRGQFFHRSQAKTNAENADMNKNKNVSAAENDIILVDGEFQFNSAASMNGKQSFYGISAARMKENIERVKQTMTSSINVNDIQKERVNCASFSKKNKKNADGSRKKNGSGRIGDTKIL